MLCGLGVLNLSFSIKQINTGQMPILSWIFLILSLRSPVYLKICKIPIARSEKLVLQGKKDRK